MTATLRIAGQLDIPLDVGEFERFRRWSHSADFPERGRVDYLRGRIDVDMSPEEFFSHGTVKTEILRVIGNVTKDSTQGHLATDSTRVVCEAAGLSAEPDIVFGGRTSWRSTSREFTRFPPNIPHPPANTWQYHTWRKGGLSARGEPRVALFFGRAENRSTAALGPVSALHLPH